MKTFRYLIAGLLLLAALPSQSKEEEISVSRSWGKLSGTLTGPDEGSDAAVLIIAGSGPTDRNRSEEHTSELQSHVRISYAVLCLKK